FCSAVEEALGVGVPEPARAARAALLEVERLYNHVADLGALCMDVGYGILNVHAQRVREDVLRLGAELTGHRLMRGGVILGGAELTAVPRAAQLTRIADDVAEIVELALQQSVVVDRFTATGALSAQNARQIGVLGYVGRASGVDIDARRDHPSHPATADVKPALRVEGDVLARFAVRAEEVAASVDLLKVLLPELRSGRLTAELPDRAVGSAGAAGSGLVEGWRGTIAHRVELGPDGRLTRLAVVDPSFLTWPALPVALQGMIVADFPVINKSFNLSYAGNDL
ncbi:MAG: formate hydrogenase, partial [Demequina sp.]|nr:formate hydrogenase [Demequina sp.]